MCCFILFNSKFEKLLNIDTLQVILHISVDRLVETNMWMNKENELIDCVASLGTCAEECMHSYHAITNDMREMHAIISIED